MAGPYRDESEPPLARYALRTSWQAYVPIALGAPMLLVYAWLAYTFGALAFGFVGLMLAGTGVMLLVIGIFGARALRVAGGRGELRIFRDRIDVPRPYGREPLVLTRDAFQVSITQQVVRFMFMGVIPAGEMNRGFLITLHYTGGSRVLSDRLFQTPEHAQRAVNDLARVRAGLDPLGPDARPPPPTEATRDELDARIDDELRDL